MNCELTTRIEGAIPVDLSIEEGKSFLFISKDQQAYTHGIHKYPAKFFPELPRWLIEKYSNPGDYILDPFMGSGTTNLEALLLERRSAGIDVDPFSRFISKVKTTPLNKDQLIDDFVALKSQIENYEASKSAHLIPEFPYRSNWFKNYILDELAFIKERIRTSSTKKQHQDFFLVCFSSIIRAVSEADNNCTRTVIRKKLQKQVPPGYAISLFLKRSEKNIKGMCDFWDKELNGEVTIPARAKATSMPMFKDGTFDLALTSPPYLNAVDYPRTHQLEIYWLGFESGSLRDLKSQHIGTEIVSSKDYREFRKTGYPLADETIKKIFEQDPRRAFIATKYILDMADNLREVYRVLKHNGRYIIVIGNNLVRGIEFESWKYLREVAPSIGFKVETYFISEIINHFIKVPRKERINNDHILVLRK